MDSASARVNQNSSSRDTTNSFALHLKSRLSSVSPVLPVVSSTETANFTLKDDFDLDLNDWLDFQDDSSQCANSASDSDSSLIPKCKPITEKAGPFKTSINPDIGNFMGNVINDGITGEFDGLGFLHCETMMQVLRSKFGMGSFRTNQLQVINSAMLGNDCFVLMPTGGGKSLCYQLPALLCPGVTIVVSPLRSLILDQVQRLLSLDIAAVSLTSDVHRSEQDLTLEKLQRNPSEIKLVYICPEKLKSSCALMNVLKSLYDRNQLSRFIIDEAHCISQWGHDFRPSYVGLAILKKNFPRVPLMAVTATATPRVRLDIMHQLGIQNSKWFLSSFDRPNLKYEVKLNNRKDFIDVLKSPSLRGKSGIVFCLSRKECEETAAKLRRCGINAAHYHAGLGGAKRKEVQNDWLNDRVHVICATIAFGMGIDKRDVRFVIHHTLPSSIEDYFQVSGRAGRDGNPSVCILYFCSKDVERWEGLMEHHYSEKFKSKEQALINKQNLSLVVEYGQNQSKCRRVQLLEHFGQRFSADSCKQNPASMCDNCARTTSSDALLTLHQRCLQELVAKCNEMASQFKSTFPAVMGIEALKSMSLELPATPQQMRQVPGVSKDKVEQYGFQLLEITVRYSAEKSLLLNPRRRYESRSSPWKRKRGGSWEEERKGYDKHGVSSSSSTTSLCSNSTYGGGFGGGSGGNSGYSRFSGSGYIGLGGGSGGNGGYSGFGGNGYIGLGGGSGGNGGYSGFGGSGYIGLGGGSGGNGGYSGFGGSGYIGLGGGSGGNGGYSGFGGSGYIGLGGGSGGNSGYSGFGGNGYIGLGGGSGGNNGNGRGFGGSNGGNGGYVGGFSGVSGGNGGYVSGFGGISDGNGGYCGSSGGSGSSGYGH